jgi:hypothetical protein
MKPDFLEAYDLPERDIDDFWDSTALRTTPGISQPK